MGKFVDLLGKEWEFECLGCDIATHKLIPPGGYVYDDGFINISADPEIPIKGFMVLATNKHVKSMNDFTEEEFIKICKLLNKTIKIVKKVNHINEVLIIQEERAQHFHIWIVPIYEWMNDLGKRVQNIDKIINYAKQHFNNEAKEQLLASVEEIRKEFNKKS